LNINNPYLTKLEKLNLFNIRQLENENLMFYIEQILQPAVDAGFEIKELDRVPTQKVFGELNTSLTEKLVVKLEKNDYLINLSNKIPKLVKGHYFIINGRQKIPLYQLYDIPVVTRGSVIKIRTNATSLIISHSKKETEPNINISYQGRKVPLAYLLIAYFGLDVIKNKIKQPYKKNNFSENWYGLLLEDLKQILSEKEITDEDIKNVLGYMYSKYDPTRRLTEVLYGLDLILKVDIFSRQYFETDCLPEEILKIMKGNMIDDKDFRNKRIRCFEYLILSKYIKAVYDLCVLNKCTKKIKFNINSSQVFKDVNVSDIVQFDFSINPIEELTKLSRTSILGGDKYGGFTRDNVPNHLRDVRPSMKGRLCPVDTPDRENCGVLQSLLPTSKISNNLQFSDEIEEKYIVSIPVQMVPFLEHNDQTRLQMASSQMRQAIMIKNLEEPIIKSGCEHLYTDKTQFCQRAEDDGRVEYLDDQYMIIKYKNGKSDMFDISIRDIYTNNMDVYKVYFSKNDEFKKGDILFESQFCNNGCIQIGTNLHVGFMSYYGLTYEDGIVISDRLVKEGILTSMHIADLSFNVPPGKALLTLVDGKYNPLPKVGDVIEAGVPYAKMKDIPSQFDGMYVNDVFKDSIPLTFHKTVKIIDVKIYVNNHNVNVEEYVKWISRRIKKQLRKVNRVKSAIKEIFEDDSEIKNVIKEFNLNSLIPRKNDELKVSKDKIDGVRVVIKGIYEMPIEVGDKIGNRHGNKGIITYIQEEEKMPQLEDGRRLDVILGPLGVPSRMNVGQLYELYLTKALYQFKESLLEDLKRGVSNEILKNNIRTFIRLIDKTEGNWYFDQFSEQMPEEITEDFIKDLKIYQPPFDSISVEDAINLKRFTGASDTSRIFDPLHKLYIENEISTGYMYMFKMTHKAEEKLAARSTGPYSKKVLQPLSGKKNKGGQRLGEMEQASIIAHNAPHFLYESFSMKSDSTDSKNNCILGLLKHNEIEQSTIELSTPESVSMLMDYLKIVGVKI